MNLDPICEIQVSNLAMKFPEQVQDLPQFATALKIEWACSAINALVVEHTVT